MTPARLLIAALFASCAVALAIFRFGNHEQPAKSSFQPAQSQAANLPAHAEVAPTQTSAAKAGNVEPGSENPAGLPAIPAFKQWAETAAASGFPPADRNKGMELAKARAISMKTLIQKDPTSALRQALPADLRALLPPEIAAAIEQPVRTTGMCSMRMMCNHASDAPHGNCEATPVLLEDVNSWNAYYGDQQWQSHLGQCVGFEGVAVEGELAVQRITPAPAKPTP